MSDAFRESDSWLFRNSVTFVTGFGVIADQPFFVGSPSTTGSSLVTYNQIVPLGGISGYLPSGGSGYIISGQTGIYHPSVINGGSIYTLNNIGTYQIYNANAFTIYDSVDNFVALNIVADGHFSIYDFFSKQSAEFYSRNLYDTSGNNSINWGSKLMYNSSGVVNLNWNTSLLTGNWYAQSLNLSSLLMAPASTGTATFNLGTNPCFVYTGATTATATMPPIANTVGQTYFIKNRGNTLTLTGSGSNLFFLTGATPTGSTLTMVSGQGYTIINDSIYWEVISRLI